MKSLVVLFTLSFCSLVQGQTPVEPILADALQHKIDSCANVWNLPGISVSVLLPDNKYWNGTSGMAHIYTPEVLHEDHTFFQASVTKLFVSTMIFQLIEQGELELDDTIGEFLPEINSVPSSTKIRYLLNQRSGIYDFIALNPASSGTWYAHPDSIWNRVEAFELYGDDPVYAQNTSWSYSNPNYILLGMVIESITGQTFAEALNEMLKIPYGLDQLFMPPVDEIPEPRAHGWTSFMAPNVYDTDAELIINDCSASMIFTAGFLNATPKDVVKFTRLLFTGQIVSETSLSTMKTVTAVNFSDGANGYGYGVMRYPVNGKIWYGHGGDFSGFTTFTAHNVTDSITMAISINRNNAPRKLIVQALVNVFEDETLKISEQSKEEWKIFPNPASGTLNLERISGPENDIRIELWDEAGKLVLLKEYVTMSETASSLELSGVQRGFYIVKICDGQSNLDYKVTVE